MSISSRFENFQGQHAYVPRPIEESTSVFSSPSSPSQMNFFILPCIPKEYIISYNVELRITPKIVGL